MVKSLNLAVVSVVLRLVEVAVGLAERRGADRCRREPRGSMEVTALWALALRVPSLLRRSDASLVERSILTTHLELSCWPEQVGCTAAEGTNTHKMG